MLWSQNHIATQLGRKPQGLAFQSFLSSSVDVEARLSLSLWAAHIFDKWMNTSLLLPPEPGDASIKFSFDVAK